MAEQDHEEIVLSRWERMKKWWEIFKFGKWLYGLLFVVTGTIGYGQITETNPLRDAAINVGLIGEFTGKTDDEIVDQIIDEYEVIEKQEKTTAVVPQHNHPHTHDLSKELSNIIPEDHMELH